MAEIYLPERVFGLSKESVILNIKVHFTNKDKSIVILDNETNSDFVVEETCE